MIRLAHYLAPPLTLLCASAWAAERLGGYPVDPAQASVSGISSGAFMANQLHVGHSADIMGAAMIAGRSDSVLSSRREGDMPKIRNI